MKKSLRYLRRYPLSLLAIAVIIFLTFYRTSGDAPSFPGLDKIAHFLMYATLCSIILFEYYRSHTIANASRIFWFAVIVPILFSGVMELSQGFFTSYRSGDFYDFLFNAAGVLVAAFSCILYKRSRR